MLIADESIGEISITNKSSKEANVTHEMANKMTM